MGSTAVKAFVICPNEYIGDMMALVQEKRGNIDHTETLDARYGQTNEEALAREYLERKRLRKPENEKETARVMRRLVAAGFSTSVIYKILRQWDVPEEALMVLDNLDEEAHGE